MTDVYSMTRRLEWDMGHRVPLHASKCKNLHGHRYTAEITCEADDLSEEGFVVDFGVVKQVVGAWIDEHWDHNVMYQRGDALMEHLAASTATWSADNSQSLKHWYVIAQPPTAEYIAKVLFEKATQLLASERVRVTKVVVFETPNCSAEWSG